MMAATAASSGPAQKIVMPCAACKLLRRKCAIECPFAPYFHPSEPQRFAAVHKVYGASNVSKMLLDVPENHRADVANSLVYEANARLRDPVYGCLGIISSLQQHAQALQAELHEVRTQIMRLRFQESVMAAAASANTHLVSTPNSNIGPNFSSTDADNNSNASAINDHAILHRSAPGNHTDIAILNRSAAGNHTDAILHRSAPANHTAAANNIGATVAGTTHVIIPSSHTSADSARPAATSPAQPPSCPGSSAESTVEHPNMNTSKEHYWSTLHQSCR